MNISQVGKWKYVYCARYEMDHFWLTCVPPQGPQKDDFELPACMKIAETVAIVGL